jgi:glucose/arabinose dehydrogenase
MVLATIAAALAFAGCTPDPVKREPASRAATAEANASSIVVPATVEVVAPGLRNPWGLAFLPDGTALVTERETGRILAVSARRVHEAQRLTDVFPSGEGGLLGIAVSPNYATDKWVYVYYTTAEDNRVARLRLGTQPQPILTGIRRGLFNNGGPIAFGPDGLLYVGTGDVDDARTPQDMFSLNGKILRVSPDGSPASGNPFRASPVYSYGHRNLRGLAWDAWGRLYASETGRYMHDELNPIYPGRNYGWPHVEGVATDPKLIDPIATWSPVDTSPSGIAVLDDKLYGASLTGRLLRLGLDGGTPAELLVAHGRLRTVTVAPDRSLWVLTANRQGGTPTDDDDRVLRVTVP